MTIKPAYDFLTNLGFVEPPSFEETLRAFMADRDVVIPSDIMDFCGVGAGPAMTKIKSILKDLGYESGIIDFKDKRTLVYKKNKINGLSDYLKNKSSVSAREIMNFCGFNATNQMSKIKGLLKELGFEKTTVRINNTFEIKYEKKKDFKQVFQSNLFNKNVITSIEVMKAFGFRGVMQLSKVNPQLKKMGFVKSRLMIEGALVTAYKKKSSKK